MPATPARFPIRMKHRQDCESVGGTLGKDLACDDGGHRCGTDHGDPAGAGDQHRGSHSHLEREEHEEESEACEAKFEAGHWVRPRIARTAAISA